MQRTEAQIAVDEALTAAIEGTLKAYELQGEDASILTGYVVLVAQQGFETDGSGNTRFNWLCKDDSMPWHHIYGLMDMSRYVMDQVRDEAFRGD